MIMMKKKEDSDDHDDEDDVDDNDDDDDDNDNDDDELDVFTRQLFQKCVEKSYSSIVLKSKNMYSCLLLGNHTTSFVCSCLYINIKIYRKKTVPNL